MTWLRHRLRVENRRATPLWTLGMAFFLIALILGTATLGARFLGNWVAVIEQNVHVVVYLHDGASPADVEALTAALKTIPGVERIKPVTSDEALERVKTAAASLGSTAMNLAALEAGFLPPSLEIGLSPSPDLAERANDLAARLRALPAIAEADPMTEGLVRLNSLLALGRGGAIAAGAFAAIAAIALLISAMRRARADRRDRARVLVLLGETANTIRLPDGIAGAVAALVSTALALLILQLGFFWLVDLVQATAGLMAGPVPKLAWREMAMGLGVATLLGALSSAAATPVPQIQNA